MTASPHSDSHLNCRVAMARGPRSLGPGAGLGEAGQRCAGRITSLARRLRCSRSAHGGPGAALDTLFVGQAAGPWDRIEKVMLRQLEHLPRLELGWAGVSQSVHMGQSRKKSGAVTGVLCLHLRGNQQLESCQSKTSESDVLCIN